jgi:hypothetical protein
MSGSVARPGPHGLANYGLDHWLLLPILTSRARVHRGAVLSTVLSTIKDHLGTSGSTPGHL